MTLISKFNREDVVLWDNFPDDLIKRDPDSATKVLEIISSRNVKNLLITLKPRYLELYRSIPRNVPELYAHELTFNRENIKGVVRSYGTYVAEIFAKTQKNIRFTEGLGEGLRYIFPYLRKELQEVLEWSEENAQFVRGLGMGFGNTFAFFSKEFQNEIFEDAEKY